MICCDARAKKREAESGAWVLISRLRINFEVCSFSRCLWQLFAPVVSLFNAYVNGGKDVIKTGSSSVSDYSPLFYLQKLAYDCDTGVRVCALCVRACVRACVRVCVCFALSVEAQVKGREVSFSDIWCFPPPLAVPPK